MSVKSYFDNTLNHNVLKFGGNNCLPMLKVEKAIVLANLEVIKDNVVAGLILMTHYHNS